MNLKDTYNKIASDWVRDHSDEDWWKEGTDALLSRLSSNALVLDVGCGGGIKSKYISNKGFKVTGIDFSEEFIEIARDRVPESEFEVVDLYELEKFDKTFDCVFAQAVLLHFPKKDVFMILQKMNNKLNPGGLLYVAVKRVKDDGVEEKIIKENDYGYEYERFFSFFTLPELEKYFTDLGLEIVWTNITGSGRAQWVQIIGKKA